MDVAEHAAAPVGLAVELVNVLTPGHRRGVPFAAPEPERRPGVLAEALRDRPNRARTWEGARAAEHAAAAELAALLRSVFVAADDGDVDAVAGAVNALLAESAVTPVLSDHDGEAWHLHAHGPEVGPAAALAATCALGLAELVAAGRTERLGVCAASGCDRVFHDTSRNGSRRYCSSACQARAKTAAFRARHAS